VSLATSANESGVILRFLSRRQEVWLIILLALAVRLVAINAPYTSIHWIKQLQIAPIARNFYEDGYNILWPETDYSADRPGYIEIEFQLVTFLTALLYPIFGIHEWVGRAVTISFSIGSLILLYALLRRYLGARPAAFGLLFFAFAPSNWYYSRVLMSEPLMLFFSIGLVYFFSLWLGVPREASQSTRRGLYFGLAVLCGALAFLVKLPTLVLVFPLLFIAHRRYGWALFRQPLLYLVGILTILPAVAYYHHAHVNIGAHYFTVGVGFGGGMWASLEHFLRPGNYSLMMNRLLKDHLTAVGFVLLAIGLLACDDRGRFRWNLFHIWLGAIFLYFIVVAGGNLRQTYYQLPLLLPASGLIGLGWDRISRMENVSRLLTPLLVALFLVLAVWGVQPFYEQQVPAIAAAADLDRIDPGKQPVIVFPPGFGCLYYFERPGWVGREGFGKPPSQVAPEDIPGPEYVTNRIKRGARWAVYFETEGPGVRPDLKRYLEQTYSVALTTKGYTIYELSAPKSSP